MQFLYIHTIFNRGIEHWTNKMLTHLDTQNLGWAKSMKAKLQEYQLESDWNAIKQKTKGEWKRDVTKAVDNYNKAKLLKQCTTVTGNTTKIHTKTKRIYEELQSPDYSRLPNHEITKRNKQGAKTLILARHGMLECGANYKGTMTELCKKCCKRDDENHTLNGCSVLNETNWANSNQKIDFNDVYSNNDATLTTIIEKLECIWEFRYANGRMRRP